LESRKNKRLRILSFAIIGYMLLALAWWSYLLYVKNNDAYHAKAELLKMTKFAKGDITNYEDFQLDTDYLSLQKEYEKQEQMIMGEAIVLALTLIIGIWFINRGYQKQTEIAKQSRNFLLSITHELKSPLSSIKLILQTFGKRKLEQQQIEKFSKNALNETERLESLVNNLLLAARMDTTNVEIHRENIELFPLLDGIRENIIGKNPEVNIELDIKNDAILFADNKAMISIFINLIENAIKYSDKPSHIIISHSVEEKRDEIYVKDNGWGIPADEKKRIFDKFYRSGNEDTRKTKGTGLGLYIVQQIIKAHKGEIRISDNTPKGTTFNIYLPRLK
jgi:two-component system phosphate regulon sensor histidine kinase PhoR